jgi:outer membrane murein-binding lipoprotein Lpp
MPEERLKTVRQQLDDIENFHKWRWRVLVFFGVILTVGFLVGSIAFVKNQNRLNDIATKNRALVADVALLSTQTNTLARSHGTVLCGLKSNIEKRIEEEEARIARTEKFINDLKTGKRPPIPGITLADLLLSKASLERDLRRDQTALEDFSQLTCG